MLLCELKAETSKCFIEGKKCRCDGKFQRGGGNLSWYRPFPVSHKVCYRREDTPVHTAGSAQKNEIARLFSVGQRFKRDENLLLKGMF